MKRLKDRASANPSVRCDWKHLGRRAVGQRKHSVTAVGTEHEKTITLFGTNLVSTGIHRSDGDTVDRHGSSDGLDGHLCIRKREGKGSAAWPRRFLLGQPLLDPKGVPRRDASAIDRLRRIDPRGRDEESRMVPKQLVERCEPEFEMKPDRHDQRAPAFRPGGGRLGAEGGLLSAHA